jgi:hypothetical protein
MSDASAASSAELKAVCQEMDEILVAFMEKLQQYQSFHSKAVGHVKNGYLAITKARLNAGGIHLKADLTLEPMTAVSCDFIPDSSKNDELEGRYSHRRVAYDSSSAEIRTETKSSSATRRRVVHEDLRDDSASSSDVTSKNEEGQTFQELEDDKPNVTTNIAKPKDPFSAFGFMARTALKPAQTQFNSALSYLIESADASQELLQLERRFEALKKKKTELSTISS